MLDAPAAQIAVDADVGAAATPEVRRVRHGVRKLIDAVAAVDEQAGGELVDGLSSTTRTRRRSRIVVADQGRAGADARASRKMLTGAAGSGAGHELLEDEQVAEAHAFLRDWSARVRCGKDGVPRLHRGTRKGGSSGRSIRSAPRPIGVRAP